MVEVAITRKVIILFFCTGLFFSCIATGYVGQREYQLALGELVAGELIQVLSRTDLPLYFYRQDALTLQELLGEFLQDPAVVTTVAYNNLGDLLAARDRNGSTPPHPPSLESIRENFPVTETSMAAYDREQNRTGTGFWSSLLASNSTIHLATPVLSPVNPTARGLVLSDFAEALLKPTANNSLVVIGYIDIAIDNQVLLANIRPVVGGVWLICMALFLLCSIPVFLILRRATAPLEQLKQMATRLDSGESAETITIERNNEFGSIAKVLNSLVKGTQKLRNEGDLEHKLLRLKAEERASLLAMREEELSKATEEISATREQLHRIANYDRLTSLPNRHLNRPGFRGGFNL
jgi:HAMP domain-containing protein